MREDLVDKLRFLATHLEVGVAKKKIAKDVADARDAISERLNAHKEYADDDRYDPTELGEYEIQCLFESARRLRNLPRSILNLKEYQSSPSTAAVLRATANALTGQVDLTNNDCFPLTDLEQEVLDIILSEPIGKAITGAEIIQKYSSTKSGIIDQSTLTKNVIPVLKRYRSVYNRPNLGYYVDRPSSESRDQ